MSPDPTEPLAAALAEVLDTLDRASAAAGAHPSARRDLDRAAEPVAGLLLSLTAARWAVEDGARPRSRCRARTRDGRACRAWPLTGAERCSAHASPADHALSEAVEVLAHAPYTVTR